jgi:hypothetical protein
MMDRLEHVEPDYPSAAEAWLAIEATKLVIAHRDEITVLAKEYAVRLKAESEEDA